MNILFIYPSVGLEKTVNHGIAILSAILKSKGHKTDLIHITQYRPDEILKKIEEFRPGLIAISSVTSQWELTKTISALIKKNHPMPIVVGGAHPLSVPESLSETGDIDGFCVGEGDFALPELIEKIETGQDYLSVRNFWFNNKGEIIKNPLRDLVENLDELPMPDKEIFGKETWLVYPNFFFNRGCPYSCTYCINNRLVKLYQGKGKYIRVRSIDKVMEEIESMVKKYSPPELYFDDDTFTKNRPWTEAFCVQYKKRFRLPFSCNLRPELLTDEVARMLKESGVKSLSIGIETGNEELRRKVLGRNVSNEKIIAAFKLCKKYGIKTYAFNMIGVPGETEELFMETVRLNREAMPDEMQLTIFYPFPGTALGDLSIQNNYIKKRSSHGYFFNGIIDLPGFSNRRIRALSKKFRYLVYKETDFRKALNFYVKDHLRNMRALIYFYRLLKKILNR